MTIQTRTLRLKMLATTATAAILSLPTVAHAQLVNSGDLVSAEDSAGNPGQLTITNPNASTANISVLAPVVVANWNQFNVPVNTTLNVSNASAAAQASLLNRVIGGNFSNISGTVNAAGVNFWLVNQNGILFGDTASVSASSFYASTLDVTDADFFDFYEGTDLAGNGTGTIHFQTNPAATTFIGAFSGVGTSPTFVTDGTLMFVGPALNLTGTFDAGTGKASFIAATDVDVSFNAGSPVGYTITAGTTVADQLIDGSVTGNSADFVFALQSSAGVMSGLLQIDADVATNAVSTDRGIYLFTTGDIPASVTVGGAWTSSGGIEADVNSNLTINQNASGSYVDLEAARNIVTAGLTATSSGIDIDSTAGGYIDVGALNAATNIAIDTSGGTLEGTSVNAGGAFTVGASADPDPVIFTGNISAGSVDIGSGGSITLEDVTASAGNIALAGMGSLNAGTLTATGLVKVDNSGTVALDAITADSDGIGAEGVLIGTVTTPASVTIAGATRGGSATIRSLGNIALGNVTSTAGLIDIDTTNGSLSAGAVSATGGDAQLTAVTTVTTTSISSTAAIDVDSTASGNLNLGNLNAGTTINLDSGGAVAFGTANAGGAFVVGGTVNASSITASGNVIAGSVDFNANGNVSAQNVSSTAGDVTIDSTSGTIGAGLVSATGGDAVLTARGSITTSGLSATAAVSARSTNGGAVSVGNISAGGSAALNTAGSVTAGSANVSGVYSIGAGNIPNSVTLTGDVTAGSVFFRSSGLLSIQDVTATAGSINVSAANLTGSDLSATAIVVVNASNSVTLDSVTADSDGDGAGSALIGQGTTPVTLTINGPTSGASAYLRATDINVGNVTATAGGATVTGGTVTAGAVGATGGDAIVNSVNNLTTTSITSTTGAVDVDSTGGGNLNLGNLAAATTISVDTSGSAAFGSANAGGAFTIGGSVDPSSITASGNVTAGSIDFDSTGALNAQDITASAGLIDIDGASVSAGVLKATGGLTVDAAGPISLIAAVSDSDGVGGEALAIGATTLPSSLTITGSTSGGSVDLQASGNVSLGSVASGAGDVDIDSTNSNISAGFVSASGGNALLTAPGSIATTGISASNAIDVDSTGGGNVSVGNLNAGTTINLDTAGALTTGSIVAGTSLLVGTSATPSSVTFTGDAIANSMTIMSLGAISTQDLESNQALLLETTDAALTTGNIVIRDAGASLTLRSAGLSGNVNTGSLVTNGGDILVSSRGDIVTGGRITSGLGATPTAGTVGLHAAGAIATADISAGEDILVNAGLTFSGGQLVAGDDVDLVALRSIEVDSATTTGLGPDARSGAFAGSPGSSSLVFGAENPDLVGSTIRLSSYEGDLRGGSFDAADDLLLTALTGDISVYGLSEAGGDMTVLSSGDVLLAGTDVDGDLAIGQGLAPTSVTLTAPSYARSIKVDTSGLLATQLLGATAGNIDVAAGSLSGGAFIATGDVTIDASGPVTLGGAAADSDGNGNGALIVGGTTRPSALTISHSATGATVDLHASGDVNLAFVASASGDVDIDSMNGDIAADFVSASGGDALLKAAGAITTGGISASGVVDVESTGGGDLSLGNLVGSQVVADTAGALSAFRIVAEAGAVDLDAGTIDVGAVSATDGITLDSSGPISAMALLADSDGDGAGAVEVGMSAAPTSLSVTGTISGTSIDLQAAGSIAFGTAIAKLSDLTMTSDTGSITGGGVIASGNVSLDAGDSIATTGGIRANAINLVGGTGVSSASLEATGGSIDVDVLSGSIRLGSASATNGNVELTASADIETTGPVSASSAIYVESTGGGNLTLGEAMTDSANPALRAGGGVKLDTTGSIVAGATTAGGQVTVGEKRKPASVVFTGPVSEGN